MFAELQRPLPLASVDLNAYAPEPGSRKLTKRFIDAGQHGYELMLQADGSVLVMDRRTGAFRGLGAANVVSWEPKLAVSCPSCTRGFVNAGALARHTKSEHG